MGSKPETVSDTEHDLCGRENYNTERKSHFFFFQEKHPHSPLCRLLLVPGIFRLTATVSEFVIEGDE